MTNFQKLLHWLREIILWGLSICPGLWIIYYGANGIRHRQLTGLIRTKSTAHNEEAVAWGWIFIGIGIWALGQGLYLKTEKPFWKLLGLVLALVSAGIGTMVLLRKLVS